MARIVAWTQDTRFLMPLCLATAAASAISHHCFYQTLNGRRVDQQSYSQSQNIYIGTALTTITKLCLSAAVLLAFSQVLWRRLLGQRLRISHIDSLSLLATTPSALDDWRVLRNFPLLTTLAVVAWCLSIITVFPPGTLSVAADLANFTAPANVSSMDFTLPLISDNSSRSIGHSGVNLQPDDTTNFTFPAGLKASAGALGVVAAYTGVIPRIRTAETNTSYSMTFFGPALECSTKQVETTDRVACYGGIGSSDDNDLWYISFTSFAQEKGSNFRRYFDLNVSVPIISEGNSSAIGCDSISSFRTSTFGTYTPELFVVAQTGPSYGRGAVDPPPTEWAATSCQLRNATYKIKVETSATDQIIDVTTTDYTPLGLATDYIPNFTSSSPDLTGPSANQIYNYYAMLAAIAQIVVGTVNSASDAEFSSYNGEGAVNTYPAPFPGMFNTRLGSSPELQAFAKWHSTSQVSDSAFVLGEEGPPLARQLEKLFRNITTAMLSSPTTSSSTTVDVLHWNSVNVYKYTAWHLWLPYGIGLVTAAAIVCLGFIAISVNGAPYSTKLSTFLRTAHLDSIEGVLSGGQDTGSDPLPRDIAKGVVMLTAGSVRGVKHPLKSSLVVGSGADHHCSSAGDVVG